MSRIMILLLCLLAAPFSTAAAQAKGEVTKDFKGMQIIGNDESPKSLYIVPWKSSELGVETSLNMMLNDSAVPVDRDVFMRQLNFYEVSTAGTKGKND